MDEQDLNIEIGFEEIEKRFDSLNSKASKALISEMDSNGTSEIMTRSKAMQISTMGIHLNDLSESIFKNVNDDDLSKSRRVPSSNMSKSLMGKLDESQISTASDLMTKSLFVPKSGVLDDADEEPFDRKRFHNNLQNESKLIENPSADYVKPTWNLRKKVTILLGLIVFNLFILGVFLNLKNQNIKLFRDARVHLNDLLVHLKGYNPENSVDVVPDDILNNSSMLDELLFKKTQAGSEDAHEESGSSFFEQLSEIAEDIMKKAKEINITLQSREEPKSEIVVENEPSLIWLNVGGRRFNITQGILYNNDPSFVEFVRLARRVEDEYWFARNGDLFDPIYSYIVLGRINDAPTKKEQIAQLAEEAKYFRLNSLSELLTNTKQNNDGVPKKRTGFLKRLFNKLVNIF